jgi:PEP-CTERM motif
MKKLFLSAVLVVMVLTVCAHADLIIGNPPDSANCIPFSCRSIDNGNYEQIYNSSAFNGTINIGDIEFYNTYFDNGGTQGVANLNFSLFLAVTSQSVPDGSIPAGAVLFGNYSLNGGLWTFGDTLTFSGTPFFYDPTLGNLELILETSGGSDPTSGTYTYFDANSSGPFSRWCGACGSNQGYGLVTGFSTASNTVPEPSSFLLMGSGLLAAVGVFRRKLAGRG